MTWIYSRTQCQVLVHLKPTHLFLYFGLISTLSWQFLHPKMESYNASAYVSSNISGAAHLEFGLSLNTGVVINLHLFIQPVHSAETQQNNRAVSEHWTRSSKCLHTLFAYVKSVFKLADVVPARWGSFAVFPAPRCHMAFRDRVMDVRAPRDLFLSPSSFLCIPLLLLPPLHLFLL